MKSISSIILLTLTLWVYCQKSPAQSNEQNEKKSWKELKAERKALKQERKAQQDSLNMLDFENAMAGIRDTMFVLQAHTVFDKYGNNQMVSETINFVAIVKNEATVQLGFPFGAGLNGVGGVTLDGKVTRITFDEDKKGFQYVRVNVMGTSLNAEIFITLTPGSNRAEAQVSANTLPYKVRYDGNLVHSKSSSVFKGRSLM